jgi:luciferase family oxidoreductase group 1
MPESSPVFSVLDLVLVRANQTTGDAIAASIGLARTADELGFCRYWVAEHHNAPAVAATNPPMLIAMIAAATNQIRVGSGGVMLPNHAPLVVAEQFALLEAAHPGRIDLGLGRAGGSDPATAWALRHGAGGVEADAAARFPEYVDNVVAMMEPEGIGLGVGDRTLPCGPRPMRRRSLTSGSSARRASPPGSRPRRAALRIRQLVRRRRHGGGARALSRPVPAERHCA